ncbi:MAG TPA: hypothetical protein VNO55_22590 [Polyangia bacterium]|nr:hypothetical protein [Polyangia bacterium]
MSRRPWFLVAVVALASQTECSGNKGDTADASADRSTTGNPGTGGGLTGSGAAGSGRSGGAGGQNIGSGGKDASAPEGSGGSGAGGTPALPADTGQSVLERNKHSSRDGHFVQPKLTHAASASMTLDAGFNATYKGATWAVPLYMEDGPNHSGAFFVATIGNDVAALDETTGATIWTRNLGAPYMGAPCGGSYNLVGIFGTPVIDATSRTIFVTATTGPTLNYVVHALSVDDGTERPGWPIDTSVGTNGFPAGKHNQRSALSLVNGILYIPFGGHYGDCNPYQGRVLAIDIKTPTKTGLFTTKGDRGAIWAAGGLASDGNGVFVVTSNGSNATHQPDDPSGGDSEAVFRLTGMAAIDRSAANYYYPARWKAMDQADNDFGSNSPVYIQVPGATPASYVVATSKDGHMAFLDSQHLGGMEGHVVDLDVAQNGMSIHTAAASYTTAKGVYVTISTDGGAHCPPGSGGGRVIMGVRVEVAAGKIAPAVAWCAPSSSVTSPIATTTDGHSDPIVWYVSGTTLTGVDGDTGKPVANASGACAGVMRWTSAMAAKGRIVTGGSGNLCSWSVK